MEFVSKLNDTKRYIFDKIVCMKLASSHTQGINDFLTVLKPYDITFDFNDYDIFHITL